MPSVVNTQTQSITGTLTGAYPDGVTAVNVPIAITAATATMDLATYSGKFITLSRAAGQAITLPAATGSGAEYEFFILTTITSNSTTIKVANSVDIMAGLAIQAADAGSTVNGWETGATDDTITFNGSTTGGIKGDKVRLKDVASGVWHVEIVGSATGTEATPFSSTV